MEQIHIFFIKLTKGIKNLIKWFSLVWNDRDYDNSFLYYTINFKINNMLKAHQETMSFEGSEFVVRDLKICSNLLEKIKTEFYGLESMDYVDSDIAFLPREGEDLFEVKLDIISENLDDYIKKYPLAIKKAKEYFIKNRKKFVEDIDEIGEKKLICRLASDIRQKKAKELLFKILNEKIEYWWY